jgi:transposase
MTDAEWTALSLHLRRGGPGRPARDARRIWDGIFWVACSRGPWRDMPAEFGKPDTAHRALRRAAEARHLHGMLLGVSDHPLMAGGALRGLEWFIVRAFRRAFRIAPHAIAYARRLGLADALPAPPCWLPKPDLSETVKLIAVKLLKCQGDRPLALLRALHFMARRSVGLPRMWRATV